MEIGKLYYHKVHGVVIYQGISQLSYGDNLGELHVFETEKISGGKPSLVRTKKTTDFQEISVYTGDKPLERAEAALSTPVVEKSLSFLANPANRVKIEKYIVGSFDELLKALAILQRTPKYKVSYAMPPTRNAAAQKLIRVLATATGKSEAELIKRLNVALKKGGRELLFS